MKYEICKIHTDNGVNIYTTIAWTDNRTYAQECADGLALLRGGEYAVCMNGEPLELNTGH